jgi:asparagine synthase (glutamine-hydrolysing)
MIGNVAVVSNLYEEPFADYSAVPTLFVSRLAREHVTVALSGEGGDEIFGGYTWYRNWLSATRVADGLGTVSKTILAAVSSRCSARDLFQPWSETLATIQAPQVSRYGRLQEWFTAEERATVLTDDFLSARRDVDDYWYFRRHWREDLGELTRLQYLDLHTYLPDDLLTKLDRASMAVSLEARVPFLDHELVEYQLGVAETLRIDRSTTKRILRQLMKGRLPESIVSRPKVGFTPPLYRWMNPRLQQEVIERLQRGAAVAAGVIDPAGLRKLVSRRRAAKLWALLMLEQFVATT